MILAERTYKLGVISLDWDEDGKSEYAIVQIREPGGIRSCAAKSREDAANLFFHTSLYEDRFEEVISFPKDPDGWVYDKKIEAWIREPV